jgi:glucose-6-phosphate 1-dehydrogenase
LPARNETRFRLGWEPQTEELTCDRRPESDQRAYDRLIGAALEGERRLYVRQGTGDAARKILDQVLGDITPVHPDPRGRWAPRKPIGCCPTGTPWHDPPGPIPARAAGARRHETRGQAG